MSKGDQFRSKYYDMLDQYTDNFDKENENKEWLEGFARANMNEMKSFVCPFATHHDHIMERIYYDLGSVRFKKSKSLYDDKKL